MSEVASPPARASERMLRDARVVLDHPEALPTASWARAVAVLGRRALEQGLDEYWSVREPAMRPVRAKKAQFIALRYYCDDAGLAGRLWVTWSALSDACHHHAYELPPTEGELRRWLETVEEFLSASGPADGA